MDRLFSKPRKIRWTQRVWKSCKEIRREYYKARAKMQAKITHCRICGDDEDLEVHHIRPVKEGGSNAEENLIVLCRHCHRVAHSMRRNYKDPEKYITKMNVLLGIPEVVEVEVPNKKDIDRLIKLTEDSMYVSQAFTALALFDTKSCMEFFRENPELVKACKLPIPLGEDDPIMMHGWKEEARYKVTLDMLGEDSGEGT